MVPPRIRFHRPQRFFVGRIRSQPSRWQVAQGWSINAWKSRFKCAQHYCSRPNRQPMRTRSRWMTPASSSPSSSRSTSASRLLRQAKQAKNVNVGATTVHTGPGLPWSAIRRCSERPRPAASRQVRHSRAARFWRHDSPTGPTKRRWPAGSGSCPGTGAARNLNWRK